MNQRPQKTNPAIQNASRILVRATALACLAAVEVRCGRHQVGVTLARPVKAPTPEIDLLRQAGDTRSSEGATLLRTLRASEYESLPANLVTR